MSLLNKLHRTARLVPALSRSLVLVRSDTAGRRCSMPPLCRGNFCADNVKCTADSNVITLLIKMKQRGVFLPRSSRHYERGTKVHAGPEQDSHNPLISVSWPSTTK